MIYFWSYLEQNFLKLEKTLFGNVSIQSIFLEFQVGETTIRDWKNIKKELYELEKRNNLALVPQNILCNSNYPGIIMPYLQNEPTITSVLSIENFVSYKKMKLQQTYIN